MVHVAYVSSDFYVHNFKFLKYLANAGATMHWIILANENENDADVPKKTFHGIPGIFVYDFYKSYPQWHGLKLRKGMSFSRAKRLLHQMIFLRRCLRKIQPDVLHGNYVQYDGFKAALSLHRPFLEATWGSDVLVHPHKSRMARVALRFVARRADVIYCDCKYVMDKVMQLSGVQESKFQVFPQLGVDTELFHPEIKEEIDERKRRWGDCDLIVSTRRLMPIYCVDILIRAIPLMLKKRNVHVLIIGGGPLRMELEDLASNLGVSDHVTFLGAVDNFELPRYLRMADLYVSTSHSDGSSLSLLEAMACGKPVVVSDLPANREWVIKQENGCLFSCGDYGELANRVLELLDDKTKCLSMGKKNALEVKNRGDIICNASYLVGLYKQLSMGKQR